MRYVVGFLLGLVCCATGALTASGIAARGWDSDVATGWVVNVLIFAVINAVAFGAKPSRVTCTRCGKKKAEVHIDSYQLCAPCSSELEDEVSRCRAR